MKALLSNSNHDGPAQGYDRATGIAVDSAGDVTVTGYSLDTQIYDTFGRCVIHTVRYAGSNGDLLWEQPGPPHLLTTDAKRDAISIAVDSSRNAFVTGSAVNNPGDGCCSEYFTVKYLASGGVPDWEKRHRGSFPYGNDAPFAIVVDPDNNVIVTGRVQNGDYPGNAVYRTIKYDGADGELLWQRSSTPPYPGGDADIATALAVDSAGNVAVTGGSQRADGVRTIYTVKYATDGQLLWQHRHDTSDSERAVAVAMDNEGNVAITGPAREATATPDFYTAKYAAADGLLLWEQRYDGCIHGGDYPDALVIDPAGNVIVSGGTATPNQTDFYLAKYAAENGRVLWTQRYDGPTHSFDFGTHLAVDQDGNVIVTGSSQNGSGDLDIVTLKYDPSGGSGAPISCPANIVQSTDPGQCSAVVNYTVPTVTDECGNPLAVACSPPPGSVFPIGTTVVTCTAANGSTCDFTVTVQNPSPTVSITGPPSGTVYAVGTPVTFTGTFADNPGDTHSAQWLVDSLSVAGIVNEASRQVTATAAFSSPGVYLVTLTVTDNCGNTATADTVSGLPAMIVIYDPNGGFVTGGGWLNSPAGAYTAQPTLTGKASFGFVSRYQKGATVPTGETEFQFQVANFNFHSSSYEWLVIAGARGQYKGSGTVNRTGDFGFILTAIDGNINGGGGADKFRIKIWDKAGGAVVYDNQLGASDSTDPNTAIGGGSIVIHK
jgi:hypothetical protein